jgi:hypothetical protein
MMKVPLFPLKGEYPTTTDRLISTFGGTRLVDDVAADEFKSLLTHFGKGDSRFPALASSNATWASRRA